VGGRNKQRATFEKRQREMSRLERQAEKRARRQGKVDDSEGAVAGPPTPEWLHELPAPAVAPER
jgi:hypothetical protein